MQDVGHGGKGDASAEELAGSLGVEAIGDVRRIAMGVTGRGQPAITSVSPSPAPRKVGPPAAGRDRRMMSAPGRVEHLSAAAERAVAQSCRAVDALTETIERRAAGLENPA